MELRKRKIDNQNKMSAAKVVKQDEDEENQRALNPLFMTDILLKILDYLDIDSLKESRLVCLFWRFEGGKILLKKSNVKLEFFETKPKVSKDSKQLENFLKTTGISAPFNSTIKNMENPNSLKNILPLLLQRSLSLNFTYKKHQSKNLLEFLEFFPNLQVLHLKNNYKEFLQRIHAISLRSVPNGVVVNPENVLAVSQPGLINKLESLKEIRLGLERYDSDLLNLLLTRNELAVKEIVLRNNAPICFAKYLEAGCNWPIETLVLEVGWCSPQSLNTIGSFLEKISGSLKHLGWTFNGAQNLSAEYLVPWANNLMNPSAFTGLETLEIYCYYCDANSYADIHHLWLFLACALQLPNLKKLTLNKIPGNLEKRIREWNNHPAASGRTLKSESLAELKITNNWEEISVDSMMIFSRLLWPNLKSLWIENPPNSLPTSFLLSEWIGLERLDIKFETMKKSDARLWTKWFAGRQESDDANYPDDADFSLKDFKDLKHFGLWESGIKRSGRIGSDFLAENSLKFMTQLQSLYLKNPMISPEVKSMLKETLGPHVNIVFDD